ncbi:unnamed protein product [Camellia sinensis]
MAHSSKDLLDLELKNSSSSNLESTLLVCKNNDLQQSQNSKTTPPDGKPFTSSVPKSHVFCNKDEVGKTVAIIVGVLAGLAVLIVLLSVCHKALGVEICHHPRGYTELISGDQNGNIRVWDLTANSYSCELDVLYVGNKMLLQIMLLQIFNQFTDVASDMAHSSKDLLDLELKNSSSSNLESTLIVCKNDNLQQLQNSKPTPIDGKPFTSSVPKSHVMGKVKDFLGVMSEANQRLQNDAKTTLRTMILKFSLGMSLSTLKWSVKLFSSNSSMDQAALIRSIFNVWVHLIQDLMLGVADLHTPEAVSAAQSAIVGYQPVISLAASSSETESESSSDDSSDGDSEDDSDDDYNDDNATATPPKLKRAKSVEDDSSSESSKKHKPKKQPKIVELS